MSIGYACILSDVPGIRLKSCTLRYATEEKLRHITLHNLWALNDMLDYNIRNGIQLFRISSDIIPFGSHPINRRKWWEEYNELLTASGKKIRDSGMRVSMHPGQYTILNSPDREVVERAITDLMYHARFLNSLDVGCSHKMILHIGGVYGNKEQSACRFIENCKSLPSDIQSRLVLENDERSYHIADVMAIAAEVSLPVVFDNLHHFLNTPPPARKESSGDPADSTASWIRRCRDTWKATDGRQKIHYAQQMAGGKPGAHSLSIDVAEFLSFYSSIKNMDIDIMLEVKDKNLSAIKCIQAVNAIRKSGQRNP